MTPQAPRHYDASLALALAGLARTPAARLLAGPYGELLAAVVLRDTEALAGALGAYVEAAERLLAQPDAQAVGGTDRVMLSGVLSATRRLADAYVPACRALGRLAAEAPPTSIDPPGPRERNEPMSHTSPTSTPLQWMEVTPGERVHGEGGALAGEWLARYRAGRCQCCGREAMSCETGRATGGRALTCASAMLPDFIRPGFVRVDLPGVGGVQIAVVANPEGTHGELGRWRITNGRGVRQTDVRPDGTIVYLGDPSLTIPSTALGAACDMAGVAMADVLADHVATFDRAPAALSALRRNLLLSRRDALVEELALLDHELGVMRAAGPLPSTEAASYVRAFAAWLRRHTTHAGPWTLAREIEEEGASVLRELVDAAASAGETR